MFCFVLMSLAVQMGKITRTVVIVDQFPVSVTATVRDVPSTATCTRFSASPTPKRSSPASEKAPVSKLMMLVTKTNHYRST